MNVMGTHAAMSYSAEPDIKEWADQVALNPARTPPGHPARPHSTTRENAWRPIPLQGWPGWRT